MSNEGDGLERYLEVRKHLEGERTQMENKIDEILEKFHDSIVDGIDSYKSHYPEVVDKARNQVKSALYSAMKEKVDKIESTEWLGNQVDKADVLSAIKEIFE